jgi:hypothetical protein
MLKTLLVTVPVPMSKKEDPVALETRLPSRFTVATPLVEEEDSNMNFPEVMEILKLPVIFNVAPGEVLELITL